MTLIKSHALLLTHSTLLLSSVPSWHLLGNLRAQLRSSRYFCLWHGTHSQNYRVPSLAPPNRKHEWWRSLSSETLKYMNTNIWLLFFIAYFLEYVASPCHSCLWLCPSASDSKSQPHRTDPAPSMCCRGYRWLWPLRPGRQLSWTRHVTLLINKHCAALSRAFYRAVSHVSNLVKVRSCRWNSKALA